ncbi:flavin reductase [Micromonospora sp. CPCC 205539]|uniref:flavin reductase n=1 Tax=Micromonospora sp. CPCC 205539 TaxID=3122408 RepID=UPI002FF3D9F7
MMAEEFTTVRAARAAQADRAVGALERRLDGEHLPSRPGWACRTCEQDWPCDPARVRLAEAYGADRIGLSMYVGSLLFVVTAELPAVAPTELYERFVLWTR